jgi:hypothetical protein
MPTKPPFLTAPQWQLLTYAVSEFRKKPEWGKIASYYTQQRTLEALLKHGMIKEDFDMRDPAERENVLATQRGHTTLAASCLAHGNWQQALHALEKAEEIEKKLGKRAYWITEEAKRHLGVGEGETIH